MVEMDPTGPLNDTKLAEAITFLRRYALRAMSRDLRNHESVTDIVQSSLRTFLHLTQEKAIPSELATGPRHALLARVAFQKIVDRVRYHRVRRRHQDQLAATPGNQGFPNHEDPAATAAMREQLLRLDAALAQLTTDQRTAVVLFYFEQLPHAEIAARLHRSVDASKMLLSRAIAKLAGLLGEDT